MTESVAHKVLLLGPESAGKTGLIVRYTEKKFTNIFTKFFNTFTKTAEVDVNGKKMNIQFVRISTASELTEETMSNVGGIMLVFDINETENFGELINLRNEFFSKLPKTEFSENFPVVLVANKCDDPETEYNVSNAVEQFTNEFKYHFFKVSAKTDSNITFMFHNLTEQMRKYEEAKKNEDLPSDSLNRSNEGSKCNIY